MLTDDCPMPAAKPHLTDDTRPPELPPKPVHQGNKGYKGPPPRPATSYEGYPEVPGPVAAAGLALDNTKTPFFGGQEVDMNPAVDPPTNPKTLMGRKKLPIFSVIPMTALLREAEAMAYGAFESPRADGGKGYGPFNWRDNPVEYMTYIDANARHIALAVDGEDIDPKTMCMHLAHARASLGILIDAIEHGTWIDDRPKRSYPAPPGVKKCDAARIIDGYMARKEGK